MKRISLFLLAALLLGIPLCAAERPTVAILPFGVAKDRKSIRWMGLATASSLIERLRRVPAVRALPLANTMRELEAAGLDPREAAWAPAVATAPLGQWLAADVVLVGAVGTTRDRKIAGMVLQAPDLSKSVEGAQIWLAVRAVDVHSGETLHRTYIEGKKDDLFALQQQVLAELGAAWGWSDDLRRIAAQRPPTRNLKAWEKTTEAEQIILTLHRETEAKKRARKIKKAQSALKTALKHDSQYAEAHAWMGTLSALSNRPESAAKAFEAAAQLDPEFTAPLYGLVDLALQSEDLAQASAALEAIVQIAPWDDDAHHLRGTVYRLQRKYDEAQTAFAQATRWHPGRHESHAALGRLYLMRGYGKRAIDALKEAVALLPGNLSYQIALADAYVFTGQIAQAEDVLAHISNLSETDPEYQLVRGKLARRTGRPEEAIAFLEQAKSVLTDRADLFVALGEAYVQQARFASAVDAFVTAQSHGGPLSVMAEPFGQALEAQGQIAEAEDLYRQALQASPKRLTLRLRLAKHLLKREAYQEAIEVLQAGIEYHPKSVELHLLLGDLHRSQKAWADAATHYARAIALGEKSAETAARLGELYLILDAPQQARAAYQQAHRWGTPSPETLAGLGSAEEALGNLRPALKAYRQALALYPNQAAAREGADRLSQKLRPTPTPPTAEALAQRARRQLDMGNWNAAQQALERAVALAPDRTDLWNELGALSARQGDIARAEAAFQAAVQHMPDAPEARYNLARLYIKQGRIDDAEAACREALAKDDSYPPAQRLLGSVYLTQGYPQRAVSIFQSALSNRPDDGALYLGLGNAHLSAGQLDAAETAYRTAQNHLPDATAPDIGLGNIALVRGDTASALAHYTRAGQRRDPAAFVNMGAIHTARGELEAAAQAYQKALDIAPEDRDVLFGLAVLYYRAGQYGDALDYCRMLQSRYPNDAEPFRLGGQIAYAAGDYEQALITYQMAVDRSPTDPITHQGLALAYEALGDANAARRHWERWLEQVQDDPAYADEAARVTKHLQTLIAAKTGSGLSVFP